MILKYPLMSEKAVRILELENKIIFVVDRKSNKKQIKKEFEKEFKAKVRSIKTQIRKNKKFAFIGLEDETPAADIATKLGLI